MKVSYEESIANYFGLQRRGGPGDRTVLSVRAKGNAGQPLSSRPKSIEQGTTFVCRSCCVRENAAFFNLKKTAAVGVDEVTWHEYEQNVEANIK